MGRIVSLVVAVVLAAGCQKASDSAEAKRMPKPPPTAPLEPPASLDIPVDIDGKPGAHIDAARLRSIPPDFQDSDRRAWRFTTLLGPSATGPDQEVAAIGDDKVAVVFPRPSSPSDPQPVLMINRRGEVIATLVAPSAPFPAYHGEGGRLGRPGDPRPHVAPVARIRVTRKVP
jgi:hypothetical protein